MVFEKFLPPVSNLVSKRHLALDAKFCWEAMMRIKSVVSKSVLGALWLKLRNEQGFAAAQVVLLLGIAAVAMTTINKKWPEVTKFFYERTMDVVNWSP